MTDGQVKYQTLMENQRHNYAMEKLGGTEAAIKQREADTRQYQAETERFQAETSARLADVREKELSLAKAKYQVATWQQIGNIGERAYNAVQNVMSNGFGFLGNMINAIKGVGSITGTSTNSKPLFN